MTFGVMQAKVEHRSCVAGLRKFCEPVYTLRRIGFNFLIFVTIQIKHGKFFHCRHVAFFGSSNLLFQAKIFKF